MRRYEQKFLFFLPLFFFLCVLLQSTSSQSIYFFYEMTLLIHAISFCVVEYRFRTNSSQYSNWEFSFFSHLKFSFHPNTKKIILQNKEDCNWRFYFYCAAKVVVCIGNDRWKYRMNRKDGKVVKIIIVGVEVHLRNSEIWKRIILRCQWGSVWGIVS
jgi:hypothetical protein